MHKDGLITTGVSALICKCCPVLLTQSIKKTWMGRIKRRRKKEIRKVEGKLKRKRVEREKIERKQMDGGKEKKTCKEKRCNKKGRRDNNNESSNRAVKLINGLIGPLRFGQIGGEGKKASVSAGRSPIVLVTPG